MHALITGGAGFIGSNLADRLLAAGHAVTVLDDLSLGRRDFLVAAATNPRFRFVEGDAREAALLDAILGGQLVDVAFHLAANSDFARSHAAPVTDFDRTLGTSFALLDAMRRHQVRQIVFASSSAIYGDATGVLREDHGPLLPISHYGAAKLASEGFIAAFAENYGLQAWIARFPNVVGQRLTHGAVHDFVARLRQAPELLEVLGNGQQTKPYLHVDDLIDAVLHGWAQLRERVNLFNIAGTTRCSVARIAEIVVEESGRAAAIRFGSGDRGWIGDVPSVALDTSRITATGWTPQRDSESAIRAAARWAWDQPA